MAIPTSTLRRRFVGLLAGSVVSLAFFASPSVAAERFRFFEETASAFWAVPHECADETFVQATLLVQSTRDFASPATADPDPTARVQYQAICPDGTSYSWATIAPATITSTSNLKRVTVTGAGSATDILGVSRDVTFDVTWTATGPVQSSVNGPGSTRKQREATATGQVTFGGDVLVSGEANHPTRPAPFIRVDIEK
jgi:hypothetical protein